LTSAARALKLTPAEEGRREVINLEDDVDTVLVSAEDALGAMKSRGAGTGRPARMAAVTSEKLRPFHQAWQPALL
jgi:hypothetical protein